MNKKCGKLKTYKSTSSYMWVSILLKIVISFIIIMVGHHLWIYIKDNYSVKKTKDLVGSQIQKYKTILSDIQEAEAIKAKAKETIQIDQSQLVMYQPDSSYIDLKNDLEEFLQELQ
jgi:hypothetical protein